MIEGKGEFQLKFGFIVKFYLYFIIIKPLYFICNVKNKNELKTRKGAGCKKEHVLKSHMYSVLTRTF